MAITISGENNNDRITAADGVIDTISGFNISGIITASSFTGDLTGDVTGNLTGNVTGNINNSTLLLQTGGTERLRIESNGRIAVGGFSGASNDLHIKTASSPTIRLEDTTNTCVLLSYAQNSNAHVGTYSNHDLIFDTNSTERLRITSAGEVGIGTVTPESGQLQVIGSGYHQINISGNKTANANKTGGISFLNYEGSRTSVFQTFANNSANTIYYGSADSSARGVQNHIFYVNSSRTSTSGHAEKLRITSVGELRIPSGSNTTSRLTFGGGVNIYHDNNFKIENFTGYLKLQSNNQINIDGSPIYFRNSGGTNRWIINSSGHLVPGTAATYNIGSTAEEIGNVYIADDKKLQIGSSQDLQIYHTNSGTSWIRHTNSSEYFILEGNQMDFRDYATGVYRARMGTAVQLYYNGNNVKLSTTNTGITVTGEVAASQDYPNFRPTVDFNFTAEKKLDPRITYQRTGPASFTNEFGKVILVGDNFPRFDHDPDTGECKGLLIEESRTNYLLYSEMLENWSFGVGTDVFTASSGSQLSANPDGSSPAYHYVPSSTSGHHRHNRSVTVPTLNTNYVVSLFVKRVTAGSVSNLNRYIELEVTGNFNGNSPGSGQSGSNGGSHVVYDLQNLTIHNGQSNNTHGFVGDSKLEAYPNDWYRLSYVFNPGSGSYSTGQVWWGHPSTTAGDAGNEQGNGNPSFYFWGASVEKGSFLSSYIPTTGSTVTRGADLVKVDGEEFSEFYNPIESTILIDYTHDITSSQLGTDQRVYRFRAVGGSDTRIDYVSNSGFNPYIAKDGSAVASISHGQSTVFGGGVNRSAVRVKEDSFGVSFNGSAVVEDTSGAWNPTNTITELTLGSSDGGSALNGHIQRFMYYSTGLPNSQLVTLTS